MTIRTHRHDWSQTAAGYRCTQCDAEITNAEVLANPGIPTGVHAADHNWRKNH